MAPYHRRHRVTIDYLRTWPPTRAAQNYQHRKRPGENVPTARRSKTAPLDGLRKSIAVGRVPRLRSRPTLAATQPPRSAALGIAMVDRAKLPDAVKKLSKLSASSNKATTERNSGSALPAPEESGLATDRTGVLCDSPHGAKAIAENPSRKAPDYSSALPRHPAVPLPRLANKTFNILSRATPSPTPTPFQTPQHQLPHPGKHIKVKNIPPFPS